MKIGRRLLLLVILAALVAFCGCRVSTPLVPKLTLTISVEGEGAVTPTSGRAYDKDCIVDVTPTPSDGWLFDGWIGANGAEVVNNKLIMTSDKTIVARFVRKQYPLTVTVVGLGSVQETVVAPKSTDYDHGTVVRLTANPDTHWQFDHWEGALAGSTNPAEITVTAQASVTAVFVKKKYALTVETVGDGTVEETVVAPKSTDYDHGTVVRLTATPSPGWLFGYWSGDASGSVNPLEITVDSAKSVTAVFVLPDYAGYDVGREWVYAATYDGAPQSDMTWEVIERRVGPTGYPEFKISTQPLSGILITKLADGYYDVGYWRNVPPYPYSETRYDSPAFMYPEPITLGSPGPSGTTAVGPEQVIVPAGTYSAWKFDLTPPDELNTIWFVPFVGIVKYHQTETTPSGSHTTILELKTTDVS